MRDLASKLKRAVEEGKMSKEDAMAKWKAMSSSDDRKHHGKGRHDGHESHSLEAKLKKAVYFVKLRHAALTNDNMDTEIVSGELVLGALSHMYRTFSAVKTDAPFLPS